MDNQVYDMTERVTVFFQVRSTQYIDTKGVVGARVIQKVSYFSSGRN